MNYTFKPEYRSNNWTITMVYSGDEKYNPARINATLNLQKLNVKNTIETTTAKQNEPTQIKVKVIDEQKNPLFVKVAYKINGKTIGTANTNPDDGIATLNYTFNSSYSKNNYQITAITGDTYRHSSSNSTKNITLNLQSISHIDAINAKVGEKITIKSQVTDARNKTIKNGTIYYYLDGKVIAKSNITNGKNIYDYQLGLITPGTHNITVKYQANNQYYTSNNTNTLTINKEDSNTTAPSNINIKTTNNTTINATIITPDKKIISDGQATLYVNNKKISTVNVNNSRVSFNYTAPKQDSSNTINYKIKYSNSTYYIPSEYAGVINVLAYNKVYVSPNGNDSNNGNKTNPFKTITKAVNNAFENATIYISPGQYNESGIYISKSMTLQPQSSKEKCILNLQGQNKTLFNIYNKNATVKITNMTIKNSNIDNKNYSACILNIGRLYLNNLLFTNNTANGSQTTSCIYNLGLLDIKNTNFTNNKAYNTEGTTIKSISGTLKTYNTQFNNNQLEGNNTSAGAIYTYNSNTTIDNTQFNNNKVTGTNVTSGAIKTVLGTTNIQNSKFTNNQLNGKNLLIAGAISSLNTQLNIKNTTFENNKITSDNTAYAAGVYHQFGKLDIKNSTFKSNTINSQNGYGGALFIYNTNATIENTKVQSNNITANTKTGNALGAGIYINQAKIQINNSTIEYNKAVAKISYAGAIYNGGYLTVTKSLIKNNKANATSAAGGAIFNAGNITITTSTLQENSARGKSNGGGAIANAGNLTATSNNFISNAAANAGSAISSSGKVLNINNNYWAARYPSWSKLLYKVTKPSKYSKTKI